MGLTGGNYKSNVKQLTRENEQLKIAIGNQLQAGEPMVAVTEPINKTNESEVDPNATNN